MTNLMKGKRGLIMGVANDHSIAWAIAQKLAEQGAELAFTYQGDVFKTRVQTLAQSIDSETVLPCDVEQTKDIDHLFKQLADKWENIDFLVHSIGFSDRKELQGRYIDTSRENFSRTLLISCFSFTEIAKRAASLMKTGGSMITLTYGGSVRVIPHYNVMGLAKAALESSVLYLASDLGPMAIRVNGLSPGPMRTLAGAGISDARLIYNFHRKNSPMRRSTSTEDVGGAALYLLSDLSSGVTGEIHYVDTGYRTISVPPIETLRILEAAQTTKKE